MDSKSDGVGPRGYTGSIGDTGYTGSAGYIGLDGYTGSKGDIDTLVLRVILDLQVVLGVMHPPLIKIRQPMKAVEQRKPVH